MSDREDEIGPRILLGYVLERLEDVCSQRPELVRLPRPDEKDSRVSLVAARPGTRDAIEVLGIPGDEHTRLRRGEFEHLLVRHSRIGGNCGDRENVVSLRRQPPTDTTWREVLIEQEPHARLVAHRGVPNERCQPESLLGRPIVVSDLVCDLVWVHAPVRQREVAVARLDQREVSDERLRVRVAIDQIAELPDVEPCTDNPRPAMRGFVPKADAREAPCPQSLVSKLLDDRAARSLQPSRLFLDEELRARAEADGERLALRASPHGSLL